ncbi:hypothetical protein PENTCL1PPCAC_26302, partial [Pristionchus entomophagus]
IDDIDRDPSHSTYMESVAIAALRSLQSPLSSSCEMKSRYGVIISIPKAKIRGSNLSSRSLNAFFDTMHYIIVGVVLQAEVRANR